MLTLEKKLCHPINMLDNGMYELQDREVFKFMHQRILTQHLANYCCVISIQGLIVIASYKTSKLDLDQNQSVTDLDQSKQEISIINTKRIMFPQRLFQLGFT